MWASSFQQRARATEVVLVPRRPRTPLRIQRDLADLLTAQAQQQPAPGSAPSAQGRVIFKKNGRDAMGTALDIVDFAQQMFDDTGSVTASTAVQMAQMADAQMRISADSADADPSLDRNLPWIAAPAAVRLKGNTGCKMEAKPPPHAPPHRSGHRRASANKGRSHAKDVHAHPENRAKTREPTDTQRLSEDLELLAEATARDHFGEAHKEGICASLHSQNSPRKSVVMVASFMADDGGRRLSMVAPHGRPRKASVVWDRPWRSPPKRHSRPEIAKRHNAHGPHSQAQTFTGGRSPSTHSKAMQDAGGEVEGESAHPHVNNSTSTSSRAIRRSQTSDQVGTQNLWKISVDLKIGLDVIQSAYELFKVHATKRAGTHGDIMDLILTKNAFPNILMAITGADNIEELPTELRYNTFTMADGDGNEDIDFHEFVLWYSSHGFSEEVLLTKEQRVIRDVARRFDIVNTAEVERMKNLFDQYDLDESGTIEYSEFVKLVHELLKVPKHLELPVHRMQQFWKEADFDDSGEIGFEEFLVFYAKIFDTDDNTSPLETFYRGLRPNAMSQHSAIQSTAADNRQIAEDKRRGSAQTPRGSVNHARGSVNHGGARGSMNHGGLRKLSAAQGQPEVGRAQTAPLSDRRSSGGGPIAAVSIKF